MNRQSVRRQILAILETILVVGSAVLVVWLSTTYAGLEGDALLVSLLLLPIIVYMITSGRLSELRAGGLEAKFVHVAEDSVKVEGASETIEASVQQMKMVAKAGAIELQSQIRQLDESKPIILTLTLGREGYYDRHVWLQYMETLSQYRTFKFVVILDPDNKFVAFTPAWAMLQILRTEGLGDMFVQIINEGNIQELQRYPGVVTRTTSTKSSNVQALSEMTAQNLEALIVVDEDRRLRGVVEREQLLGKLLLGMAR